MRREWKGRSGGERPRRMRAASFQPETPRKGGNETKEGGEWGGTKVGEDREGGRRGGTKEEDKARQVIHHHVAKYIQDSNINNRF